METFYSYCQVLAVGCILYYDQALTDPVSAGFQGDGINCYETDLDGKIIAITTCTIPCDIAIGEVTSTDPTTLGGSNGTITVNFTTTHGPSSYTLNGTPMGVASSPLVVNGLESGTPYTIVITDSNGCSIEATLTLGQSATLFDADWIMATYQFTDGNDLDTRSRIAVPDIGQNTQPQYLGWSCLSQYPTSNPIMQWGGDNTGTGFESILINVTQFKISFPGATEFIADLRGFWYGALGTNPVVAAVILWKGGTPIRNGCANFCWTNPTATFTGTIDSVPKTITLKPPSGSQSSSSGERVATLKYNLNTLVAILDNADVTTPVV